MVDRIDSGQVMMRVFRVPGFLREAIDEMRAKREQTLQAFIAECVKRELPVIASQLLEMGIEKQTDLRPARWPLETGALKALAYASEQCGMDQNKLLMACLNSACRRKRRRRMDASE